VFVLLNFYEGRLIDVIRDKIAKEEGDIHWMLAGFEMELGELQTISKHTNTTTMTVISKGMKFLKSEQKALEQMINNFFDSYLIATSFEGENFYNDLLTVLQKKYHLKHFPYRMECVDISHLSGDWISGGLSCMVGGLLEKKGYRKYKIRSIKGQNDDYASLLEVLERRLLHPKVLSQKQKTGSETILPNVLILDGGKGQLGVVKKLYQENKKFRQIFGSIDFVALGKGEARKKSAIGSRSARSLVELIGERIYRFDENWNIIEIPLTYDQADKLLVKLRDEAHRFSNYYRKQQMGQELKGKNTKR
jgi:excinuclease UvrABC nuclease subunit